MKAINYFNKIYLFIAAICLAGCFEVMASSHREAPLIAFDPLADNTDVYAFRSPDDPNTVTIIANYIPAQLPNGGPNYYTFGENVRYEIHVDNDASTNGDDIIYRFTFTKTNEDPTTFFNIRLGQQNQKTTYMLEKSTDGGQSFTTVVTNGIVPPYYIGKRSIQGAAGLNTTYSALFNGAITTATSGEKVFCGPIDDPFFVDLGGIFDLGDAPRQNGQPRDALACYNVSTIAIQIPISELQKDGKNVSAAANILDPEFVIGVWASASRQQIRTLNGDGTVSTSGNWIQVSRLGMPLTNEAVIPIGQKDLWNSRTPYDGDSIFYHYFYNPELALYMDTSFYAAAVPAFNNLRVQRSTSPGNYDFGNTQSGLYGLKGNSALNGTAFGPGSPYEDFLLPADHSPRSVDLNPIFHTGVPNLRPYQLATGKGGNPLANGKPFINNFLPNGGDMLRLNMAVPVTARNSPDFNSLGLVYAAVLGLTDGRFNGDTTLQNIPNMDGFPNGRRLEDDVTRIELQAVSGVVLAAIGLGYDDPGRLGQVLAYSTGVEMNDTTFRSSFPYVQMPWIGTGKCGGKAIHYNQPEVLDPSKKPCKVSVISDQSWMKSTVVTPSTNNGKSFWDGVNGNLPASSTYTLPVVVGQPYGFHSIDEVDSARVISTGNNITYFRKTFNLTGSTSLDARFRINVDDQAEIYVNGKKIARVNKIGRANYKSPSNDAKYMSGTSPINGYMGGDAYDYVNMGDLDTVFHSGMNEIVVVVRNLAKASDKGGFSFRLDADSCNVQPACNLMLASNNAWSKSTVTTHSSYSGNWNGANGNLPMSSTFTDPVMLGQPYGFKTIDSVEGAQVIKTTNNITYFRKEFMLTKSTDLNARFRINVDDQAEIYVNRKRIALVSSFGRDNYKNPSQDIYFPGGKNPINGYMGGDMYNVVTTQDLDSIFTSGMNEVIVVVRNLAKPADKGGFTFRMDIDSCGLAAPPAQAVVAKSKGYLNIGAPESMFTAYPNPFNDVTTVKYRLTTAAKVSIIAYDVNGKKIAVVDEGMKDAGQYQVDWNAQNLPAGMYMLEVMTNRDGEYKSVEILKVRKL